MISFIYKFLFIFEMKNKKIKDNYINTKRKNKMFYCD